MFDYPAATGGPLEQADEALIEAARAVLRRHYRPFWHMVAAALRGRDGRIWTGLHLGTTVGGLQVCAETVAATPARPTRMAIASSRYVTAKLRSNNASANWRRIAGRVSSVWSRIAGGSAASSALPVRAASVPGVTITAS